MGIYDWALPSAAVTIIGWQHKVMREALLAFRVVEKRLFLTVILPFEAIQRNLPIVIASHYSHGRCIHAR